LFLAHKFRTWKGGHGFSLLEILVVTSVIALLIALLIGGASTLFGQVGRIRCTGNLRTLHGAFSAYTEEHKMWPQIPDFGDGERADQSRETWWIETMRSYGASEKTWRCPTIESMVSAAPPDERPRIHYSPTEFDAFYRRPYQWSTMPWIIENGNAHGGGALMLFPDGSIRTFDDFMGGL
jgi:prepilin-type N-terminal cleavage/methylation domain-containing protein